MKNAVVCTLSEGDYHYGVAGLCNSLHRSGFRGNVYFGTRGELPFWLEQAKKTAAGEYDFDGLTVVVVQVKSATHLTSYKPIFMSEVFDAAPGAEGVFYFDPDIVTLAPWRFFENWAEQGVAICEDACYARFPANHPIRGEWRRLAASRGVQLNSISDAYYNGGFVGVTRTRRSFLKVWSQFLEFMAEAGADLSTLKSKSRDDPFQTRDQDALNMAAMCMDQTISTIGPEAMGFIPAGYVMMHAVDSPKPWNRKYLSRFIRTGDRVGPAHRAYWECVQGPIQPFSRSKIRLKKLEMAAVTAGARFYRR